MTRRWNLLCGAGLTLLVCAQPPHAGAAPEPSVSAYTQTMQRVAEYEQAGELDKAIAEVRKLTTQLPDNADMQFWLARLERENGDFAGAILGYQRGILLDPARRAQALWNIAYSQNAWSLAREKASDLAEAVRRAGEAAATLQRLAADPGSEKLTNVDVPGALGDTRKRVDALNQRLHDEDLTAAGGALDRGTRWLKRGRPDLAQRDLLNATALDPNNARAWKELGRSYAAQQNFSESAEACRKAIAIDPKFKEAWNNLGVDLDELGQFADAIDAYQKALAVDPRDAVTLANMGQTYQKMGDAEKAADSYRRAIAIDPQNVDAHFRLAGLSVLNKDYDAALRHCRAVQQADPFNLAAASLMGDICMIVGRPDDAVQAYQQALLIDPDNADVKMTLAEAIQKRDSSMLQKYFKPQDLVPAAPAAAAPIPALPQSAPATASDPTTVITSHVLVLQQSGVRTSRPYRGAGGATPPAADSVPISGAPAPAGGAPVSAPASPRASDYATSFPTVFTGDGK